ncbi:hypothetical protein Sjap_023229 [Stephania japonica]|uniref:DRBM domain-containing protein n=1 Tax=Stephania japonica TaxID=461633 RepID=A0AAP0EEB0_9MAGN
MVVGMYKNQLQELAQRSCFNLPSYACTREGPDHAPRFKASVNFNGEIFEGPSYCTTLRQAEHAAAEVALNSLSTKGPSRSIAARVLDETGVHKNLLQETAHRAGLNLPVYTTVRSGPGHLPVFTSTVELADLKFNGAPAKTKKQAEKNAAMAAWAALKQMASLGSLSKTSKETDQSSEEQEQVVVARVLSSLRPKDENKPVRGRDLNQTRKRITLGYREKSHQQFHQRRSLFGSDHSNSVYQTQQQQSCFSSLKPPVSKILPSIPIQISSRSQYQVVQEVPTPLDEHRRDELEWLYGKSEEEGTAKPIDEKGNSSFVFRPKLPNYYSPFTTTTKVKAPICDATSHQSKAIAQINATRPYCSSMPTPTLPRMLSSGVHAHSIAPAVHIRSVIPVCAAPPMKLSSSNSTSNATSSATTTTITTEMNKDKEGEVTLASSKFKDLHL